MKTNLLFIIVGIISGITVMITLTAFVVPTMETSHQRECLYDGGKVTGFFQCTRVHLDYSLDPTTVRINLGALDPQSKNPIFPKEMTVMLGKNNTVTWLNMDGPSHFINFEDFTIGPIHQGERLSVTFNQTGVYRYFSAESPSISGSVIVKTGVDKSELENQWNALDGINRQALHAKEAGNDDKLESYRQLMQQNMRTTASDVLGMPITSIYLEEGFNFPFLPASELTQHDSNEEFQICDITTNMPAHLQSIREVELFQRYDKKYSGSEIDLFVQDERRTESMVHYGFVASSTDGNHSAMIHFHANSCTGEIQDIDKYLLSCRDKNNDELISTFNKDDILASFGHEEFCIIPLDPWRQSVYEYGKTIDIKMREHIQKTENMDKSYESVMAFQDEMNRLGELNDLIKSIVSGMAEEQEIQEKINNYNERFGGIPNELLEIIETRK